MPTYEQVRCDVVARERKKDEESSNPQGLSFLKPTVGVSRFLHQPEKRIRSMDAQVDERFGAPVVVKPHQTEHNRDDQSLVCIDIDDDLHSVIRFPSGMAAQSRQLSRFIGSNDLLNVFFSPLYLPNSANVYIPHGFAPSPPLTGTSTLSFRR